jgi:hypothetical protein
VRWGIGADQDHDDPADRQSAILRRHEEQCRSLRDGPLRGQELGAEQHARVPAAHRAGGVESALESIAGHIANDPVDILPHAGQAPRVSTPLAAARLAAATAMNQYVKAGADIASGIALTTAIDRAQGARASKSKADRKR